MRNRAARQQKLDFTHRKSIPHPCYHSLIMNKTARDAWQKRTYDIRVRNAVARSEDAGLFPEIEISRSTALEWIRLGVKEVITHPSFDWSHDTLVEKLASLERSLEAEKAKNRVQLHPEMPTLSSIIGLQASSTPRKNKKWLIPKIRLCLIEETPTSSSEHHCDRARLSQSEITFP